MQLTRENIAREYERYERVLRRGVHVRIELDEPGLTVARAQHRALVHMEQRHGSRHAHVCTIVVPGGFVVYGRES